MAYSGAWRGLARRRQSEAVVERDLGPGLRLLLFLVGATALGGGIVVGTTEIRRAYSGSVVVPSLLVAIVAGVIVVGGGVLIRGALRGRIKVRRPRRARRAAE